MKTMEAGAKLDALVAEKVFGCNVLAGAAGPQCGCSQINGVWPHGVVYEGSGDYDGPDSSIKPYSTDIAAAWAVVEHFQSSKAWCAPYLTPVGGDGSAGNPDGWIASFDYGMPDAVFGATAPLAICLAALKAVGMDVEQPETYPLDRGDG